MVLYFAGVLRFGSTANQSANGARYESQGQARSASPLVMRPHGKSRP